jgi:uncharacterized membrane protein YkoI
MKKILLIFTLIVCSIVAVGCTRGDATAESPTDVAQAPAAAAEVPATVAEAPDASDTTAYIGEDSAKTLALDHAGIAEQEAVSLTVELDREDGQMIYEVEIHTQNTEYEYEIDAYDGTILSYDYEKSQYDH